jgi:glycine oxidase
MPQIAQVRNPRLVKAARADIAGRVAIIEQAEVVELLVKNGRAIGVRTPNETHRAQKIIVCAGAWTAELFAQFGQTPDIRPVRGQMILFNAQPGEVRRIVLQQGRYAIPRRDGRVLMGSTMEHTGFDKDTTEDARDQLYAEATALLPALKRASIEKHWAGLRPGSPSGVPYIGGYPGIDGLYFNAGHFRNGVVLAPASARLMADIALQRPPIVDPDPYQMYAAR